MRKVGEEINEREARHLQLSNKSTDNRMAAEDLDRSKTSLSKSHRHNQTTCNSHVSAPPSFIRSKKSNSMPSKSSFINLRAPFQIHFFNKPKQRTKLQQSCGGGVTFNMAYKVKNGAKNAAPSGSSASECERLCQTNCRARWAQRLVAFDGVGVECFAFDSMVPDLCRLESDTSCLML